MKSNALRLGFVMGAAWLGTTIFGADDDKTIKLIADEWCPINCEAKSDKPGILIEIAQEVFTKAGYTVKYDTMTWNQAVKSVENGNNDGLVGASKNDIGSDKAAFTEQSLAKVDDCFYTTSQIAQKWKFTDLDSIKKLEELRMAEFKSKGVDKTMGAIKDYAYNDDTIAFQTANAGLFHTAFGDRALQQLIKMVQKGKLMAFLDGPWIAAYNLKALGIKDTEITKVGCLGKATPVFIPFTLKKPRSQDLVKLLDAGVKEMRTNGKMKAILDKYSVEDVP